MKRELYQTADGSSTIKLPDTGITYRSAYGALQESRHVFIKAGLQHILPQMNGNRINIFEMGFGTGLNALLTLQETTIPVFYQAAELYPLSAEEVTMLNYDDPQHIFPTLHTCEWEKDIEITADLTLHKSQQSITTLSAERQFHLVYYDAFGPGAQPELWEAVIFEKLFSWLYPGGVLVTYCSKGDVRRAMLSVGFSVEKLTGPPGKREMLRATKPKI